MRIKRKLKIKYYNTIYKQESRGHTLLIKTNIYTG